MKYGQILDESGMAVVPRMMATVGPLERMRGLLARTPLAAGECMLLDHCNAIHTIGMRYAIDVVFLDPAGRVVRVVPALPPHRMSVCRPARAVLELAAGEAARLGIQRDRHLHAGFAERSS